MASTGTIRLRQSTPITMRIEAKGEGRPVAILRDVTKTFETAAGPFQALRGVSLRIDAGEFDLISEIYNQGVLVVSRPMDETNASYFLSSPQEFVCTASVLTYYPDDPLGAIVFHWDGAPRTLTP